MFDKSVSFDLSEEINESNDFSSDLWQKMGALDLHGIAIPEKFVGANMGYLAHCVAIKEINSASTSDGLSFGAHFILCINLVSHNVTEEQKVKNLPKLVSEQHVSLVAMSDPDFGRVVLAAGPVVFMAAAMDVVVPYVHEREQFGKPIGAFQLIQRSLADTYTAMNACCANVCAVVGACNRRQTSHKDSGGSILYAAEKSTKIALTAIQRFGSNWHINEVPVGRLLRDVIRYEIGAGTSVIRRMLIGRELFNETA